MTKQEIYKKLEKLGKQDKKIKAIIVYGSFARGKKYHDIDVLVVREGMPMGPIVYGKEVVKLEKKLDYLSWDLDLDMQVVTPEIFVGNLDNHNPFYLDIVFDGEIVYGKEYAEPKFKEVKKYVRKKGIKRVKEELGWDFPVEYRKATIMSKISTRDQIKIWLDDAQKDYQVAGLIVKKAPHRSVTLSQQAIEKAIKAILICFGKFRGIHYVGKILKRVVRQQKLPKIWREKFDKLASYSKKAEQELVKSRYPNVFYSGKRKIWIPIEEYDETKAKYYFKLATKSLKIAQDFIK